MRTCVLHYDSDAELPLCQFLLCPRARVYATTMYNGWNVLCGYVCTSLLMPHCLVSSASIPVDGVWLPGLVEMAFSVDRPPALSDFGNLFPLDFVSNYLR